jgi:hypothetical protein
LAKAVMAMIFKAQTGVLAFLTTHLRFTTDRRLAVGGRVIPLARVDTVAPAILVECR